MLLLDEPLASLDAARKAEILAYIELLRDELRLPIVYVSHALEEVTRLADRVVVIADGRGRRARASAADVALAPGARRAHRALRGRRGDRGARRVARRALRAHRRSPSTAASSSCPTSTRCRAKPVRVRIRARDVSLALERPDGMIDPERPRGRASSRSAASSARSSTWSLRVGATPLVARITRKAAEELGLAPGLHGPRAGEGGLHRPAQRRLRLIPRQIRHPTSYVSPRPRGDNRRMQDIVASFGLAFHLDHGRRSRSSGASSPCRSR